MIAFEHYGKSVLMMKINLFYLLSKNAKITIFTPFGNTEEIQIEDIIKLGTSNKPVLFSLYIGDFFQVEFNSSSGIFIGNIKAGPLAYIDDLADINRLDSETIISSKIVVVFQHLKRVKYNTKKSKKLSVNCHKPISVVCINGSKI